MPSIELPNVWSAIDGWASTLNSWQRYILAAATRTGKLDESAIGNCYHLFSAEMGLCEPLPASEVTSEVSGRAADPIEKKVHLARIDTLVAVNALPGDAAMTFAPTLTVIYGRNGAGKSGFARLIANACFSRHKPEILPDIYAETAVGALEAIFHVAREGEAGMQVKFVDGLEDAELRRISFFDSTTAHLRISESSDFEFKPAGFDVFPEMARVYRDLARRLDAEIASRQTTVNFSSSFIGKETIVSQAVAAIDSRDGPPKIRTLATYSDAEASRLEEVDRQLLGLRIGAVQDKIRDLRVADADVVALKSRLIAGQETLSAERMLTRNKISKRAKETAQTAAAVGAEQFRRTFFRATGSDEWKTFAKAAHALARKEGEGYPGDADRCLLCERSFDDASRKHVAALLAFIEGDAQKSASSASAEIEKELTVLRGLDLSFFSDDARVREALRRVSPTTENVVALAVKKLAEAREKAIACLLERTECPSRVDVKKTIDGLEKALATIREDVQRLSANDPSIAIASLELEHQTLRHREVLTKLLPQIEEYVANRAWIAKAGHCKSALNPRHITEKEKELSGRLIGEAYRERLATECGALECALPIELQTSGQRGRTVRSLLMKSGHQPLQILSEGEQKAVALADFLTEIAMNPTNAGIVLDDPVSSQDHDRKLLIAKRLVQEAATRQVIVFTHDLPFLNAILNCAEDCSLEYQAHWIERDSAGRPGRITLGDVPATSKAYDTTDKAKNCLAEAKKQTGSPQLDAIRNGMGALRRTIEETVVKKLLKGVVPRWSDRVIVTALPKILWDEALVGEFCSLYEDLSAYIEGHSHTDEAMGAPPTIQVLEGAVAKVDALIKRARADRGRS